MKIYPGQIVCSVAGRDKNKYFVIMEIIDEDYVYISDGDTRKLDKRKKKKVKHLRLTSQEVNHIKNKLSDSKKISNADIRRGLKEFKEKLEEKLEMENF